MDMRTMIRCTREYRERLLSDPYRPRYHFAIPDDDGRPGDPNGMFYADGRYHMMYLYRRDEGNFHWGHVSSTDLVHWRSHKDALGALEGDNGCFSGGAFVDDDGTAYLSYWIFNSENSTNAGIGLARSRPPYDDWERLPTAVIPSTEWGIRDDGDHLGCADPSNIWKRDGVYYMQTGNLLVLDKYGRQPDSEPQYRGDWTELFASDDLLNWRHIGRFYARRADNSWTGESEDDMCPSFLPLPRTPDGGELSDKMLQLFIAHNRGCQYYIGHEEGLTFIPERHGRMSWVDNSFFAPEACMDGDNRQVMFAWLLDNIDDDFHKYGWSGVYGLPRTLWLRDDGALGIQPAREVDALAYNIKQLPDRTISGLDYCGASRSARLRFKAKYAPGGQVGAEALISAESGRGVRVYYDDGRKQLIFDPQGSAELGRANTEAAPLELDGELDMTVYVDNSVVEVFANGRQAITRRAFTADTAAAGIALYAEGGADFSDLSLAEMDAANMY